ncbi:MAG: methyltransferase domain-containing protein, partial [Egibacteraceae bacterium]
MPAEPAPEEQVDGLLRRLVDELVHQGAVRSPQWRAAFERVPRHLFVPRYYQRTASGRVLLAAAEPAQRQAWLDGVYRDAALPIAYADDDPTAATSSSTQPSLMARML